MAEGDKRTFFGFGVVEWRVSDRLLAGNVPKRRTARAAEKVDLTSD